MHEEFHKARRNLSLLAGLLLAWAIVGLEVGEKPFPDFDIRLLSPQAAPSILIALVLYFSIRLVIEWYRGTAASRTPKAAKFDYALAQIIAALSVLVFLIQKIAGIQIANELSAWLYSIFSMVCFLIGITAWTTFRHPDYENYTLPIYMGFGGFGFVFALISTLQTDGLSRLMLLLPPLLGIGFGRFVGLRIESKLWDRKARR